MELNEKIKTVAEYNKWECEYVKDTIVCRKATYCFNISEMEYNTDWNLLIPVAKKVVGELDANPNFPCSIYASMIRIGAFNLNIDQLTHDL